MHVLSYIHDIIDFKNMPSWIKYFKVYVNHVRTWLLFQKGNNPEYRSAAAIFEGGYSHVFSANNK